MTSFHLRWECVQSRGVHPGLNGSVFTLSRLCRDIKVPVDRLAAALDRSQLDVCPFDNVKIDVGRPLVVIMYSHQHMGRRGITLRFANANSESVYNFHEYVVSYGDACEFARQVATTPVYRS